MATGTVLAPILLPDDAFSAFRAAEGKLKADLDAQTSAGAALQTAQDSKGIADASVSTDSAAASAAVDGVIASLEDYKAALPK